MPQCCCLIAETDYDLDALIEQMQMELEESGGAPSGPHK